MILASLVFAVGLAASPGNIESVLAHPPLEGYHLCGEHMENELKHLGDNLGTDCVVHKLVTEDGRTWARAHEGDGTKNEHWYGWMATLLSPCDCTVEKIRINPVVNEPGRLGEPPASVIVFKRADGVYLLMAHVQEIAVAEGDTVTYGQPVAKVGNNGYGRIPHVHMGAWKGETPLQIRWDTSRPSSDAE